MSSPALPPLPPPWGDQDSYRRVEEAIQRSGHPMRSLSDGSLLVRCVNPAHPDRTPSMHVSWEATEHGGRTLIYCPACGPGITQEEWAEYLGLTYDDLFDDRRWSLHNRPGGTRHKPTRVRRTGSTYSKLGPLPDRIAEKVAELTGAEPATEAEQPKHTHDHVYVEDYPYVDADSQPVQRVAREVCECGAKNFPQTYFVDGVWVSKAPAGFTSVLYRLPQVRQAVAEGRSVWLVEGEKDVHTVEALGEVATTNTGGGTNFQSHLAKEFADAHVTVVLDRDDTGWMRGVRVHRLLTEAGAATVRLALPMVKAEKADLTDHVEAGYPLEQIDEVPLEAVAAWAGLRDVRRYLATIETCETEAAAQLQVARYDAHQGRKARAADRRRYAVRWAKEASRAHVRMLEAARQVQSNAQAVAGDKWALEAAEVAVSVTRAATGVARAIFDSVKEISPSELVEAYTLLDETDTVVQAQEAVAAGTDPAPPEADAAREGWQPRVIEGGGGGSTRSGVRISSPNYSVVFSEEGRLELVEIKHVQRGRGDDTHWEESFSAILNCQVLLKRREFAESDDEISDSLVDLDELGDRDPAQRETKPPTMRKQTHAVIEVSTGQDDETQVFRIPFDDYADGSFVAHLPVPGLKFASSRSGREKVVTAINAVSTAAEIVTSYRATGWRRIEGEDVYITANGAITPQGWTMLPTNLTGSLARFDLPIPTQDKDRLRAAFLNDSGAFLDRFTDRVGVVLVGTMFRAVLCPNEWVTVLSGSPGVFKTGLAALTMHHLGELWDRTRPLTSVSGNGATMNALRLMLHQIKDAVAFLDDNAPTTGVEKAYERLEFLARMIHNAEDRPRSSRDGQETLDGGRPRGSGLITTEMPPRAGSSGGRRLLMVPLSRGDVDLGDVKALDRLESRHGRALLTSSFLRWVAAGGRKDALGRLVTLREEFLDWITARPGTREVHQRHSAKIAELFAGWGLLLDFLTDAEALTVAEADLWRERVAQGLLAAAEASEDPDLVGSTGQRVCELLRHALGNGLAYASDIRDDQAPEHLERRLGWMPSGSRGNPGGLGGSMPVEWRRPDKAIHLGYVNTDPSHTDESGPELVCSKTGLESVIKAAAAAMTDTSSIDLGTALRALEDEGILKIQIEQRGGSKVVRKTLSRVIHCEPSLADPGKPSRGKRVVLRLDALLGDEAPEPPAGGGDDPSSPPVPGSGPRPSGSPQPQDPAGTSPQTASTGSDEQDDDPAPEQQEDTIRYYTNTAGLQLPAQHVAPSAPCAHPACPHPSGIAFGGVHLHVPCFEATTVRNATELTALAARKSAPETAAAAAPVAAPAVDRTASDSGSLFVASSVVVDVDGYYLPGQGRQDLPFPIEHAGHLEELGRQLRIGKAPMKWRKIPEAGLVVPTEAMWQQLGVPTDVPVYATKRREWFAQVSKDLPFLSAAAEQGWVFGRGDQAPVLRGMTRLRREGTDRGSVAIMFTPGMPADWGISDPVEPAAVARRLELVSEALGLPFRASPISTGLDLMRIVLPRQAREALTAANAVDYSEIGPAASRDGEPTFNYTRPPSQDEKLAKFLALFDRGGSYLSAWSSLKIGIGAPERHEADLAFDPARAGWWQVQLPKPTEAARDPYPDLLDPEGNRSGQQVWVTTPVLEYAKSALDLTPQVLASWTWPAERSKAWLKPLYEVLRDALNQLRGIEGPDSVAAQRLVKEIYKQLSGHFISTDSDTLTDPGKKGRADVMDMHHPYAYHAMRGKARVGMLHQILTIGNSRGVWPLVVANNDLIGYASNSLVDKEAWPGDAKKLGRGLGAYKLDRWADLGEHAEFLTGHGWAGLDHTSRTDES